MGVTQLQVNKQNLGDNSWTSLPNVLAPRPREIPPAQPNKSQSWSSSSGGCPIVCSRGGYIHYSAAHDHTADDHDDFSPSSFWFCTRGDPRVSRWPRGDDEAANLIMTVCGSGGLALVEGGWSLISFVNLWIIIMTSAREARGVSFVQRPKKKRLFRRGKGWEKINGGNAGPRRRRERELDWNLDGDGSFSSHFRGWC